MITKDRLYRTFEVRAIGEGMIVEGYAAKFESPTVLYEIDGVQYKEVIKRGAFTGSEMSNVVMNYGHEGKPVARTKNKTLQLLIDEVGFKLTAVISGSEEGRKMYEEIKGGYLDEMSFAFTVKPEGDNYVREERLREISKFKRIYDVAVVDKAAYGDTYIQARSFFEVEAEKEVAEAMERRKKILKLKIEMEEF